MPYGPVATLTDIKEVMDAKSYRKCTREVKQKLDQLAAFPTPVRLPLGGSKIITGIIPEETRILKSALEPLLVCFKIKGSEQPYKAIFKVGDDLRQEEFVLSFLRRAQTLLGHSHLTCYNAVALSNDTGLIEFVEGAETLGDIRCISMFAGSEQARDTFVQTAADHTALMYVLGVGDRHCDNFMLLPDGRFFHIDFGYIFGEDFTLNELLMPELPLPRCMVEAMGGLKSARFGEFKQRMRETLGTLRQNSKDLLRVFDAAPQTEQYRKGREFVAARLRTVHSGDTVDELVSEAWGSKWARFYSFMAIRSCHRERLICLVILIFGSTVILILIISCIWKCISRKKRESKQDEDASDLEEGLCQHD